MSHKATNWAVQQRGLKPAVKILLWHLADRHNVDDGCFPRQDMLADDCEMSRATINRHLNELEERGLIRRVQRVDPATKKQLSTRYILAFEDDFDTQDIVSRVSNCDTEPCLKNGESRVSKNADPVSQSCETLTSKGTGKGTVAAREANKFDGLLDQLLEAAGISGFRDEKSPQLMNLAPIIGLIEAGFDLHADILPAIREKCANGFRPRSWSYFVEIVRERAGVRREAASIPKTSAAQAVRDWPDDKWQRILNYSRNRGEWLNTYGPPPFADGCLVPAHLIVDGDKNLTRVAA